ncbi:MAG: hypothetical protein AAFQ78_03535, partial [Bacteroidota bacterium]
MPRHNRPPSGQPFSAKTLCPYCGVGCGLEVFPPARPGRRITRDEQGRPVWQAVGDSRIIGTFSRSLFSDSPTEAPLIQTCPLLEGCALS